MKTAIKKNQVTIDEKTFKEYSTFIDFIANERDIIRGQYIKSNNYDDLVSYLDN